MSSTNSEDPDFRMADGQGYILDRGSHLTTARLNLQHFLWQRVLNFTIHPSIAGQLPSSGARIADVATGTGLWALDVAAERPDAHIYGYDIDLTQAPVREWLPENVTIDKWDIFEDPGSDIAPQGTFDLVHVRLLVLVLSGIDPLPVIRRLKSLLKPGGHLQWEDLDCTRMHVKRANPSLTSPSLDAIIDMSRSGGRHDWVANLNTLLESEGFIDAKMEEYDDPVVLSRAFNDQHLMTMEEFAVGLARGGKGEAAGKVGEMVKRGYEESLKGCAICYPRICCVARKPVE